MSAEERATDAATAVLARVLRDRAQLLEQVTALQTRCSELLEEARAARRTAAARFVCPGCGATTDAPLASGWTRGPRT